MADDTKDQDQKVPKRMRPFAGNAYLDYYEHGMDEFPITATWLMDAVVAVLWAFTKVFYPWKMEETELLVDDSRGRVIIMNHESMLDPVALVTTLWRAGIRVRTIYKKEFDKIKIATWFFSRVGGLPVDRGKADMKMIRWARAALKRGECILIYPEGTRIKDDEDAETHGGFAVIAQLAKAPVQPVAIIGARELSFRQRVFLRCGKTISWSEVQSAKRKQQAEDMGRIGMERLYALRDGLRDDHPGIEEASA